MQIDEIADHLRKLFKEECETLKNDIEFLYECIDKEKDYREKSIIKNIHRSQIHTRSEYRVDPTIRSPVIQSERTTNQIEAT